MDLSGSMQGAGGVGGLLSVNDGSDTYYPTFDGNGNVSEYVDATGVVVAHYEYDAFGQVVASGSKKDDFTHQFSTKRLDSESGLHYNGYRYYDSRFGLWLGRDLIGEVGGYNLYQFVDSQSVNLIDILGLYGISPARSEINSLLDGIQHYKSHAGGTVAGGDGLDSIIKSATDYKVWKARIVNLRMADLAAVSCTETSGTIAGGGHKAVNVGQDTAVGNVTVIAEPYEMEWTESWREVQSDGSIKRGVTGTVTINMTYTDVFDFVHDDSSIMTSVVTFFTDVVPGKMVGNGTPFTIRGSFTQEITASTQQECCD